MTTEWEPVTEVEHALQAALQVGDEDGYFRVLPTAELLVPLYADETGATPDPQAAAPHDWATWHHDDRTHVLAYTSETAMAASFGGQTVPYQRLTLADLAAGWPDENWWLAVNPGLPIQGYLPAWFLTQLTQPAEPAPQQSPAPPAAAPPPEPPPPEPTPAPPPAAPEPPPAAPPEPAPTASQPESPPAASEQPSASTTEPSSPPPTSADGAASEFAPANEVEKALLAAARAGNTDAFLRAMLVATVLVPLPDDVPDNVTVAAPHFRWRTTSYGSGQCIPLFTSTERLVAHFGPGSRATRASLVQVIRTWPDGTLALALNPGTPIGASLPGEQVLSLAAWAAETGLADEAGGTRPPEVMQKVIPHRQVAFYLERGYNRVAGFVYRARDVAAFDTPAALYAALGLTGCSVGGGPPFAADDEAVAVLRWPAYRSELYRTPYGGRDETEMRHIGGWVIEGPPFVGNGYAPSAPGHAIPEYKVDSVLLPHGSEIYRIGRDGGETLYASYDADFGRWLPVADADAVPPAQPHDLSFGPDGYLARWRGRDCDASPDGEQVRLYATEPLPGFTDLGGGRHVRVVPFSEVDALWYRRTVCRWRGAPFTVLGGHGQWLRVEYTGGQAPEAERLGLERFDIGVYQGWAPANEVSDRREERI